MSICWVVLNKKAEDCLHKMPKRIIRKLKIWLDRVEDEGIDAVRKTKSYHDEPLQGARFGQRSIRLNKAYRAFYIETKACIEVLEVNKHDY